MILLLGKESILTVPRLRAGSLDVQEFLPIADGGLPLAGGNPS